MSGLNPYAIKITNITKDKNRKGTADARILIAGISSTLKTTFLTKKDFSIIELLAEEMLSEKKFQGNNPVNSHRINGIFP